MNTPSYQTVSVSCPSCHTHFSTPIMTIVDAQQHPDAKSMLISGQLNVAVCPQCGNGGLLHTPMVYHDSEKEFLFTFIPTGLNLSETGQERAIGELTNRLMSSLPPEKRKGYLLRPRQFLQMDAMIEAILQGDGITPEMLAAQRAKTELLERLLTTQDENERRMIALENDTLIDYEFFQLLTFNLEMTKAQELDDIALQLTELRTQLLKWTSLGKDTAAREDAIKSLGPEITREDLLEKLETAALNGEHIKVETIVTVARRAIDYVFYQQLSGHIEEATKAGNAQRAQTLKVLRETILNLTAEIDAELKQVTDEIAAQIQEMVAADDLEQAVRDNLESIDDLFLNVLANQMEAAEQAGRIEEAQKIQAIGSTLMRLLEEMQPPEIRFISQLLSTDTPEEAQALLEQNVEEIDDDFLAFLDKVQNDLARQGRAETAARLAEIRDQAAGFVA